MVSCGRVLSEIFCVKEERCVNGQNAVRLENPVKFRDSAVEVIKVFHDMGSEDFIECVVLEWIWHFVQIVNDIPSVVHDVYVDITIPKIFSTSYVKFFHLLVSFEFANTFGA